MANVYKSAQVYFAAAVGADLITSPAASIVTSIQVSDNTGTITVDVKKGTGTARPIAKFTTNGEVLDAPIVLENGDKLIVTPTTTGATVTASYAYSSTGGALSIDALTDVDITGIADGEILIWNATSGQFEPGVGGGGVTSVNGDTGPNVVVDASDIDYTVGTTVYAKLTDHQNAIVDIQDVVKYPTDKAELQEDANNKVSVDGTTGTESITLKTDGTDALVVTDQRATVNVGLNAAQGLTVNFGAGSQYTMPTTSGNANEVIVSDGSGGTSFAPAALPTASDTLEVDGIDFNLTPTATEANGRLLYDPDIESLVFLSENGNKIALGSVYLPVVNKTTSTITLGTVVKFVGAEGDRFKIEAFDASADEELNLIGVVEKDIAQDDNGVVVQVGYIKGIDTSTYTVGDILYASTTAGGLTTTAPTKPDLVIPVAVVKTSATNGSIFVRPTAYHHLNEAHDVSTTAPTNEAVLAWNSTSQLWEPADNYANTTGTIFTGGIPVMTDSNSFKADTNLFVFNNEIISTYDMTVADLTVSKLNLNASGTALIDGISTGDVQIKSKGSIANILDSDANETGKQFSVEDSLGNKIMVVDEGGNVGIGTTTPSEALEVNGNAKVDGKLIIQDGTYDHIVIGNGSLPASTTGYGGVVIGVSAGRFGHRIQNVFIGQFAGFQGLSASDKNVAIGADSLKSGGAKNNNVAIGYGALKGSVSPSSSFDNTTAVGYQALTALTTGTANTAVGYQAGDGILAGTQNTLIGYSADISNVNGSYNVIVGDSVSTNSGGNYATRVGSIGAVGNQAVSVGYGAGSTSGNGSISIGYNAGKGNGTFNVYVGTSAGEVTGGSHSVGIGYLSNRWTTGGSNVSIGREAAEGDATSTFSNTTAVGYQALTALTAGARNTAVGYRAGAGITSGGANTLFGYEAGDALVSATFNVALGEYSLSNASTGSFRVAIGAQALENATGSQAQGTVAVGFRAGEQSTGNDNVFLGREAGQTETGSNKLYIENSSSTTPLIYGEFDNDIVRVNGTVQVGDPSSAGFALPSTDGTEDQVLTTDGSGAVTWKEKAKYCQLLRSSAQTLTTNVVAWEDLLFDSETIDTFGGGSHTAGTITLTEKGVYVLHFNGEINNVQAVNTRRVIKLRLVNNGTLVTGTERGTYQRTSQADGDVSIRYIYNKTDSTTEVFKVQARIDFSDTNTGNNYYFDNGLFILETLNT